MSQMRAKTSLGLFCLSIDHADADPLAIASHRRGRAVAEIVQRFAVPSNWMLSQPSEYVNLPERSEVTARIPVHTTRGELVRLLRQFDAALARTGDRLASVALDSYQARLHWDVLVRHGCHSMRPRDPSPSHQLHPQPLRGGLWNAPISCSFVGGSKRSLRSLLNICHRRLIDVAEQRGFFHVNVDVRNERDSWHEECEALRSLFQAANNYRQDGVLRFACLGELPALLAGRREQMPMRSILRAAS